MIQELSNTLKASLYEKFRNPLLAWLIAVSIYHNREFFVQLYTCNPEIFSLNKKLINQCVETVVNYEFSWEGSWEVIKMAFFLTFIFEIFAYAGYFVSSLFLFLKNKIKSFFDKRIKFSGQKIIEMDNEINRINEAVGDLTESFRLKYRDIHQISVKIKELKIKLNKIPEEIKRASEQPVRIGDPLEHSVNSLKVEISSIEYDLDSVVESLYKSFGPLKEQISPPLKKL